MSRRPRQLAAAVVSTVVGALVLAGCSSADGQDASPPTPAVTVPSSATATPDGLDRFHSQQVEWSDCRGGRECATVTVPLDYDDPTGATIDLAVLRAPATDPERRLGSLVVNPGGPGASGINYAAAADRIVSSDVLEVYDVVGFDPRGVGESSPVECVSDAQVNESLDSGDSTPDTPQEVDELVAGAAEFVAGCEASSPDLLPHVGTDDVARDLDVLRVVLGDDLLTYMGKSYGTSIGLEYLRQFPETSGRVLLDGVIDPGLDEKSVLLGQAAGFELALSRFVESCLDDGCSLGDNEAEVREAIERVLTLTDDDPLPTSSRPLTQTLATYGILGPLYWPPEQGYPLLEEALEQALRGNGTALLALADVYLQRSTDGTFPSNQWDVFTPISCLDRPGGATPEEIQAAMPEFDEASPLFGEGVAWSLLSCAEWPVDSAGLAAPVPASSAPPVLVVGTTGDPATPYEWAVTVADELTNGVLLTYDATPHTAYRKGSTCIDDAVDAFFLTGQTPLEGTRCT